jgi:hypothetical protein
MNKFIKNFDTFVKENFETKESNLPEEVIKSVKSILDDNFDQALRKKFEGDTIQFKVTKLDYDLEPQDTLEMDLVEGASKKRKFDVILHFVDKIELTDEEKKKASEEEKRKGFGGYLVYSIEYKPKTSPDGRPLTDDDEELNDVWEKPDDEPELVETPEEEEEEIKGGRTGRTGKTKVHLDDLDSLFRNGDEF